MDSGTLRLILAIAGLLLLGGIYYFGQNREEKEIKQARKRHDETPESDLQFDGVEMEEQQEPTWDDTQESDDVDELEQALVQLDEVIAETCDEPPLEQTLDDSVQQNLFADEEPEEILTVDQSDLPQLIIQVMVISKTEPFTGEAIQQVATDCRLQPGEMEVYHSYATLPKRSLFSMASMVEPGSFPFDNMAEFTTPGLLLFTQLPSVKPGLEIYDEMIATAKQLASRLNGELLDESRSVLRQQTIDHAWEQILEHERQIKLAGKKRL